MAKSITEIIWEYNDSKKTAEDLEKVNKQLEKAGSSLSIDPNKNVITDEELDATTFGRSPESVNGWGHLDTGTGTLDKVKIVNGTMPNCDCGSMIAFVIVLDRMYEVKGNKLAKRVV